MKGHGIKDMKVIMNDLRDASTQNINDPVAPMFFQWMEKLVLN